MQINGFGRAFGARSLVRHTAPLAVGALCLWILARQIGPLDMDALGQAIAGVTAQQWLAATLATMISFAAIGQYDVVLHRHMGTGLDPRDAQRVGMAAVALSQVLGMGVMTGALVRWRLIAPLSPAQSLQMSLLVAVSFLTAWALLAGIVTALFLPGVPWYSALVCALMLPVLAFVLVRYPAISVMGRVITLPSLKAAAAILALTTLDTVAAAAALHVLLPADTTPAFAVLFAAYLAALGAALMTGTPGGVGPFELVLLACLPQIAQPDLIAAIIAFRLVYYAVPAVLAGLSLWRPRPLTTRPGLRVQHSDRTPTGPRSEIGIIRQNGADILSNRKAEGAILALPQTEVVLFGATRGQIGDLLTPVQDRARQTNRVACLYKITARDACAVRDAGWRVLRIADEARIDPRRHCIDGPAHRQLRRILRKARSHELDTHEPAHLPLLGMTCVHTAWAQRNGGEHGATMGRFCADYIRGQRVFCATHNDRLIAFVSFHATRDDWCLDLMRSADDAPAGAMHLLIQCALETARSEDVANLSLAAVPSQHLRRLSDSRTGLIRFKQSFSPRWQPLYLAAPSWPALALAAIDLWRGVHCPPPLNGSDTHGVHHDDEDNRFATDRDSWDIAPEPKQACIRPGL